ncbi:MAG: DUF4340 domain-containing protein [Deltaproteobacteria bacterium]|nr:DUF4340 domain-containing protein [Deltaproteobacteria bacterium]
MKSIQRRLVTLGASVVAVGAVATYAYFGTYKGKQAEEEQKEKDEKVVAFAMPDIKEVRVTAKGQSFEMIGDGEGDRKWRLTKPVATPAEKSTVEGLITHFVDMKRKRALEAKSEDVAGFGLNPPLATVAFKGTDGKEQVFLIGKKNSFDDSVYLMKEGSDKVLMVPSGITYQTDRDLFAWREKRISIFEEKDVRKIDVAVKGAAAYGLEKKGDDWMLTAPIATKADKAQVTTLMSSLRYLRAKGIALETYDSKDAAKYGLQKPELVVTLALGDAMAKTQIAFGSAKGAGSAEQYYALVDGQPALYELSEQLLKKFDLKTADLRDKTVLAFDSAQVKKLKLAETGKDFVLAEKKKKEDGSESWEIVAPEQKPAEGSKISNLLYKLSNLKAKAITSDKVTPELKKQHGLDPVTKQITLYKADGGEAGILVIGTTTGDTTAVFTQGGTRIDAVDKGQLADISFDVKDYVKPEPTAAATGSTGAATPH